MDDDMDVEAMLEQVYQKKDDRNAHKTSDKSQILKRDRSISHEKESRQSSESHRKSRKHKHRSSSRDRKRSRSRDRRRSRDKDRRRRSRSSHRRRSTSRERKEARAKLVQEKPLTEEEKDARTVLMMQLQQGVRERDIEGFFAECGSLRDIRIIGDRYSRRSKGIAYVEFVEPSSVMEAFKLSGQKLCGGPVIIQPTMAQKNRVCMEPVATVRIQRPKKLAVGNLHPEITDSMLRAIFEPFGTVDSVQLQAERDGDSSSRGFAYVHFKESDCAANAMEKLNGFDLAGLPMRVGYVTGRGDSSVSMLDSEDVDKGGIAINSSSRSMLMMKLAATHGLATTVPSHPTLLQDPNIQPSPCVLLSNMFDPLRESIPQWDEVIEKEVKYKVSQVAKPIHIFVDKKSREGKVYLKFKSSDDGRRVVEKMRGLPFTGRVVKASTIPVETYHTLFPDS